MEKAVTVLLHELQQGVPGAAEALIPAVYAELRRLAANYMRSERAGHTLQPTALVHEAFLKLVDQREQNWQNRSHFFGIAAQLMRRILLDHARRRSAQRRGGGHRVTLQDGMALAGEPQLDVLELNSALDRLAELDPRQAKVVELKFFAGLEIAEIAAVTGTSPATVKRDWVMAKAWLSRELARGAAPGPDHP
jgi:RNA polymerase sigma factor (TIGR02999 family)